MKRLFSAVFLLLLAWICFSASNPSPEFAAALQELGVSLTALSNRIGQAFGIDGHFIALFFGGAFWVIVVMWAIIALMTLFRVSPKSQP
jgi:hypothetical protein